MCDQALHAVVVLAAGSASRMGSPKQLLQIDGRPMIRHAARTALASGAGHVIVVVGAYGLETRAAVADLPVDVVMNEHWMSGLGSSIQAGIREAQRCEATSVTLTLSDQPLVDPAMLRTLVALHERSGAPVVASKYAGTVGVPAFFSRDLFADLLALPANRGCKEVIQGQGRAALLVDCPEAALDIDTPDDYRQILNRE
jgi:molybdenum cofactor cytidylyltransferase